MSNDGFPSMTALLGLLAVAGFQNKDKIAEWLGGATAGQPAGAGAGAPAGDPAGGTGAAPGAPGGDGVGGFLNGGLGELIDRFKKAGHGETADSWVQQGPNQAVAPQDLEHAIGPDTLDALVRQTGLTREELLERLSKQLPEAVDRYTPEGKLAPAGA